MKLSYSWLGEYLKSNLTPEQIAEAMTSIGIEVDSVEQRETIEGGLAGVVVAKVLECVEHPNSDHLHITKVDDGSPEAPLQVVCGAPNVEAGQKVLFARVGAVLPGNFKIKKSKIRGVESLGMICAEDELGIGTSHDGIMVLPEEAEVGMPAVQYLGIPTEAVIEYEITANRVDAASHIGVARDLYAYLTLNDIPCTFSYPDVSAFRPGEGSGIPVEVRDSSGAPRYIGLTIRGVKTGPSPKWLQDRLTSIGLHPINNIVDISNFVLFELGQPLHTFDASKIRGGKVIVRRAGEGEKMRTLDGVERTLHANDMVIADAAGPMCIAGVFGGEDSGVCDTTTDVFLEAAYFDPGSIRRTSKSHTLQTDASFRYERGCDPLITEYAAKRAALLIQEIAGGTLEGGLVEVCPEPAVRKRIELDYGRMQRLIGKQIGAATIEKILSSLCYVFEERTDKGAVVLAPSYMVDVERECDVVEEVLRIYGYNNIELPSSMKMSVTPSASPDAESVRNYISNFFAANGFMETMNNSLTKGDYYSSLTTYPREKCVGIVNPLSSDLNVMRQSLILSGLEVFAYNINRQVQTIRTFEYGSVYEKFPEKGDGTTLESYGEHQAFCLMMTGPGEKSWRLDAQKGNFFQLKGYLELLLRRYGIDIYTLEAGAAPSDIFSEGMTYSLPGSHKPLAVVGCISPALARRFDVRQPVFACEIHWNNLFSAIRKVKVHFSELPRFPEVRRDLALLLDEGVPYADLHTAAFKSVKGILKQVSLFDVYRGDKIPSGKKQYALSFVFQNQERTLTDAEVDKAVSRLLSSFTTQFGATLR